MNILGMYTESEPGRVLEEHWCDEEIQQSDWTLSLRHVQIFEEALSP